MSRLFDRRDDISGVIKNLAEVACEVDIRLVSGANCCRLRGIICGVINCGKVVVVIDCKTNSKCFIPVDKIAAICKVCPPKRKRLFC